MTLTFTAVGPVEGWYGHVANDADDGLWVEVHAAPVVAMSAAVAPTAGLVPAGGEMRVGVTFQPMIRLVAFPSTGPVPDGVLPLSDAFPTGPGFELRWPEGNTLTVTSLTDPLPERWDTSGDPVPDPR